MYLGAGPRNGTQRAFITNGDNRFRYNVEESAVGKTWNQKYSEKSIYPAGNPLRALGAGGRRFDERTIQKSL